MLRKIRMFIKGLIGTAVTVFGIAVVSLITDGDRDAITYVLAILSFGIAICCFISIIKDVVKKRKTNVNKCSPDSSKAIKEALLNENEETVQKETELSTAPLQDATTEDVSEDITLSSNDCNQEDSSDNIILNEEKGIVDISIKVEKNSSLFSIHEPSQVETESSEIVSVKKPIVFDVVSEIYLKYFYEDVSITSQYYELPTDLKVGDIVSLVQEPNNEFDSKAIAVFRKDVKLGYIRRGGLQNMCNDYLDDNGIILSEVTSADLERKCVNICLAFYVGLNTNTIEKSFKVSVSKKVYEEECFGFIEEGREVNLVYDFEKEKYAVDDFGFAPKSVTEFYDNAPDNYYSFVKNVEEKENGGCVVEIVTIQSFDK